MSSPDEHKDTWQLLLRGNPQALDRLFREHYLGLINYGLQLTTRRELVRDCITQILLDLWNIRHRLPEVQNVRSYLITTLRRKIFREIKLLQQHGELPEDITVLADSQPSYEEYLVRMQTDNHLRKKINRALASLTCRQKELLRLRFFEDRSYDEIAEQCSITKRTAYNIVHGALAQLRKDLTAGPAAGNYYSFTTQFILFLLLNAHW